LYLTAICVLGIGAPAGLLLSLAVLDAFLYVDFQFQAGTLIGNQYLIAAVVFAGALAGVGLSVLFAYRNEPECFRPERSIASDYDDRIARSSMDKAV
jgi:hypothetical protein